jgi:RHS repeat-associated protein
VIRRLLLLTLSLVVPASAAAQSETVEYYATDQLGSVRVVFDANGTILARMDYKPFGQDLSGASGMPANRFANLFRDGEADLDYAQARSYQARTGRFNAPDPVYAGLFDPQQWNRYAYAGNSPLNFVDPTGEQIQVTVLGKMPPDISLLPLRNAGAGGIGGGGGGSDLMLVIDDPTSGDVGGGGAGTTGTASPAPGTTTTAPPGTNNPNPGTGEPVDPSPNECHALSGALASLSPAILFDPDLGLKMIHVAFEDPFVNAGFTNFRPELTAHGQGNDTQRHILASAGAIVSAGKGGLLAFAGGYALDWWKSRSADREEAGQGRAEMAGDIAGAKVGGAMVLGALTGNVARARTQIQGTICR